MIGTTVALMLVVAVLIALFAYRLGARSDRPHDAVLREVDSHLGAVAEALELAATRADAVRERGADDRQLGRTLERLLEEIAAQGAPAHTFRRVADGLAPELADTRKHPKAKQPATQDQLTGVRDRAGYDAELEREIARAGRTERPLSVVLLDLGELGDSRVRAGHAEVDRMLQDFAALLVGVTRVTDTVCRPREGEFGILLPETSAMGARHLRRRVREAAAHMRFGNLGAVTFSTGVAEWRPDETGESLDLRARTGIRREAGGLTALQQDTPRAL